MLLSAWLAFVTGQMAGRRKEGAEDLAPGSVRIGEALLARLRLYVDASLQR